MSEKDRCTSFENDFVLVVSSGFYCFTQSCSSVILITFIAAYSRSACYNPMYPVSLRSKKKMSSSTIFPSVHYSLNRNHHGFHYHLSYTAIAWVKYYFKKLNREK